MPYFLREDPHRVVLNGELDFDFREPPRTIYARLSRIAEDVGAMVSARICHGGRITVYPAFGSEYYVLNLYEVNEDPETLRVMHITTWRQVQVLDLEKVRKDKATQST